MAKLAFFVVTIFLLATPVIAQTPSRKSDQVRQQLQEKQQVRQELLQEKSTTRLQVLKDKLQSRQTNSLCIVNRNLTNQFTKHLNTMSNILVRIEERSEAAQARGKNVTGVDTAVASAEASLVSAQAAVDIQAAVDCSLLTKENMRSDLQRVQNEVKSARQAVGDALKSMARVLGEKLIVAPEVTPTKSAL